MTNRSNPLRYSAAVVDADGHSIGTCFQVRPALFVTSAHVVRPSGKTALEGLTIVPLVGGASLAATVGKVDQLNDLAELHATGELESSAPGFVATDSNHPGDRMAVTGFGEIADARTHEYASTAGTWDGPGSVDSIRVGEMTAPGLVRGMSGAAVVHPATGLVAGIVRSRYIAADHYLTNRVWVARTEALAELIPGIELEASYDRSKPTWARSLPTARGFVGRQSSLARLNAMSSAGRSRLAVQALGGQGKTALLEAFAHDLRTRSPDTRILWPRTDPSTPSFEQFVDDLLDLLEQQFARRLQVDAKCRLLADLAGTEPTYLVVDNWEKFDGDRNFVELLADLSRSVSVVVATRRDPNASKLSQQLGFMMQVVNLHDEDPVDLEFFKGMVALYGAGHDIDLSRADQASLLQLTSGNALALQWIIAELVAGRTPSSLLRGLNSSGSQLMQRIFSRIWQRLSRKERLVLVALLEFETPPRRELLASVAGVPQGAVELLVRTLEDNSLVRYSPDAGRISAHPLTLEYVRERARMMAWSRRAVKARFETAVFRLCREYGGDDWRWNHFDLLDAELSNVWKLVQLKSAQGRSDELVELRNLLTLFLSIRGHWDRRLELSSAAIEAAPTPAIKARILVYDVCYVFLKRGDIERARRAAEEASSLLSGGKDQLDLANVKRHLGRIEHELGNWEAAEALYSASRELYVTADPEYGAFLDWDLGDLATSRGDFDAALRLFESAYTSSAELDGKSRAVHAMAAGSLGQIALESHDFEKAQRYLEEEHQISFAIGRADEMALSSRRLGTLWLAVGENQVGEELLSTALGIFRQLGDLVQAAQCEAQLAHL